MTHGSFYFNIELVKIVETGFQRALFCKKKKKSSNFERNQHSKLHDEDILLGSVDTKKVAFIRFHFYIEIKVKNAPYIKIIHKKSYLQKWEENNINWSLLS